MICHFYPRYKKPEERVPLLVAMKVFLPALALLFERLIEDNSAASIIIQKQFLKILYALVQVAIYTSFLTST